MDRCQAGNCDHLATGGYGDRAEWWDLCQCHLAFAVDVVETLLWVWDGYGQIIEWEGE